MIVRLEPSVPDFEAFPVFRFRLTVQPMPFILVQEDLQRCDSPASLTLLTEFTHVCQCGVRPDKQHSFTYGGASRNLDYFTVLAFAFTLLFLHGTSGLFLYHLSDIVIMHPQIRTAEVGIYPLLIIGGEFWNHIGSGLSDVAHVFGSPPVVSLTRCDIAGLDMYA
ncbi:hypothetical protein HMPREF0648_1598 [Prevotella bivia JCVIHMP010]|nr:hypothetical protein HMPREF0648_1598 [Prevotella bivia JCVIHMP010]